MRFGQSLMETWTDLGEESARSVWIDFDLIIIIIMETKNRRKLIARREGTELEHIAHR